MRSLTNGECEGSTHGEVDGSAIVLRPTADRNRFTTATWSPEAH
jgi:hypothetical protein